MIKDCNTCIHKEGSCYPSTTIFDKDKTCKSYDPDYEGYIADLEKENEQLKSVAQFQQSSNMKRHFEIQELEKKNKKLESDFRICEKNADLEKQKNYAKLYYQEVGFLQNKLKTLKDKYVELKKNNTKAKKILKNIADNWKGSGLNAEKSRKILKAYNNAEEFIKEIEK